LTIVNRARIFNYRDSRVARITHYCRPIIRYILVKCATTWFHGLLRLIILIQRVRSRKVFITMAIIVSDHCCVRGHFFRGR